MTPERRSAIMLGGGMVAMLIGVGFIANGADMDGIGDLAVAMLEGLGLTGSSGLNGYVLFGVALFFGGLANVMYSSRAAQRSPQDDDETA